MLNLILLCRYFEIVVCCKKTDLHGSVFLSRFFMNLLYKDTYLNTAYYKLYSLKIISFTLTLREAN